MLKTEIYPDFITIDGAEGGTGRCCGEAEGGAAGLGF